MRRQMDWMQKGKVMIICTSPDQKLLVSKDWFSYRPIEIEPIPLKGPFFALDEATLKAVVQGYKENRKLFQQKHGSF